MSTLTVIFLFLALTVLVGLVFCAWLVLMAGRAVVWVFKLPFGRYAPVDDAAPTLPGQQRCPEALCQATNPGVATFCRRCGRQLKSFPSESWHQPWARAG